MSLDVGLIFQKIKNIGDQSLWYPIILSIVLFDQGIWATMRILLVDLKLTSSDTMSLSGNENCLLNSSILLVYAPWMYIWSDWDSPPPLCSYSLLWASWSVRTGHSSYPGIHQLWYSGRCRSIPACHTHRDTRGRSYWGHHNPGRL